jgi:histone deacetylase complex regulatory component SIN3
MRVKELFNGNHDIILGFNNFSPEGYLMRPLVFNKIKVNNYSFLGAS